jgi:hypothetical protein
MPAIVVAAGDRAVTRYVETENWGKVTRTTNIRTE